MSMEYHLLKDTVLQKISQARAHPLCYNITHETIFSIFPRGI